jgi:N6-L-threonylcarbamoyladenine synthase
MLVLGIESSCDETGVALYCSRQGLIADALYSQIELHKDFGGVVPELASRDHIRKIYSLAQTVLSKAGLEKNAIDAVAYTKGPGLAGALLVGATFANALAYSLKIPTIPVHHLEAHLLSPLLSIPSIEFPFIALLVSGGHSQIMRVGRIGEYSILGETRDDAAGEAFDKTAKSLGLPYPGGALLSELAKKGDPDKFDFPKPMLRSGDLELSFSGLKTAVVNLLSKTREKNLAESNSLRADIAASFQEAITSVLAEKCSKALIENNCKNLVVAGGVGANDVLRQKLTDMTETLGGKVFYPLPKFCTDNGAMVALTGALKFEHSTQTPSTFTIKPRWPLEAARESYS